MAGEVTQGAVIGPCESASKNGWCPSMTFYSVCPEVPRTNSSSPPGMVSTTSSGIQDRYLNTKSAFNLCYSVAGDFQCIFLSSTCRRQNKTHRCFEPPLPRCRATTTFNHFFDIDLTTCLSINQFRNATDFRKQARCFQVDTPPRLDRRPGAPRLHASACRYRPDSRSRGANLGTPSSASEPD